MKKVIKSRIFLIVLLCIISCGIGVYAATTYKASDVVYNASDGTSMNVNDALNNIYQITKLGDATADNILKGKTAVVQGKLITGTGSDNKLNPVTIIVDLLSWTGGGSGSGSIKIVMDSSGNFTSNPTSFSYWDGIENIDVRGTVSISK